MVEYSSNITCDLIADVHEFMMQIHIYWNPYNVPKYMQPLSNVFEYF